jgi:hypothetical protein
MSDASQKGKESASLVEEGSIPADDPEVDDDTAAFILRRGI